MNWAETIVQALKDSEISLIAFVPDISIHQVTKLLEEDDYFHVVAATREEEAIGIACGAYAAGRKAAVFMQSSGFGNCINAIASLCIPYRIPLPMFINLRGEVDEFNLAQVTSWDAPRAPSSTCSASPTIPMKAKTGCIAASVARSHSATPRGNHSQCA